MTTDDNNVVPEASNQWRNLDLSDKREYLDRVRIKHCESSGVIEDVAHGRYVIEGRFIKDYPSLFLELGEAISGPGGYFGSCLDAFDDCCLGGFGAIPPFTLVWKDHIVSKGHLTTEEWNKELALRGGNYSADCSLFEDIVAIIGQRGIDLIMN